MEKVPVFAALEPHIDAIIREAGYEPFPHNIKVPDNHITLEIGEEQDNEVLVHVTIDGDNDSTPNAWRQAVSNKLGENLATLTELGKDVDSIISGALERLVRQTFQWMIDNKDQLKAAAEK